MLSRGAWGRVVEGKFLGTKVAVKELHLIIQSSHNRLLFDQEIKIVTLLRHPCILQFLHVADYHFSNPWLVLELMKKSLPQLVRQEKALNSRFTKVIGLDVACALNYLQLFDISPEIGVNYRDLETELPFKLPSFVHHSLTSCQRPTVWVKRQWNNSLRITMHPMRERGQQSTTTCRA